MIIVSQDKETIVNFDNVTEIAQEDGEIGITNDILNDDFQVIAEYKTEERAKEVLQEIIEFYEISKRYECSSNNGITIFTQKTFVYEMPGE